MQGGGERIFYFIFFGVELSCYVMVFHRPSMGQGPLQIISHRMGAAVLWLALSSGEAVSEIQASREKYYSYGSH